MRNLIGGNSRNSGRLNYAYNIRIFSSELKHEIRILDSEYPSTYLNLTVEAVAQLPIVPIFHNTQFRASKTIFLLCRRRFLCYRNISSLGVW